jgi:hypothetical protein
VAAVAAVGGAAGAAGGIGRARGAVDGRAAALPSSTPGRCEWGNRETHVDPSVPPAADAAPSSGPQPHPLPPEANLCDISVGAGALRGICVGRARPHRGGGYGWVDQSGQGNAAEPDNVAGKQRRWLCQLGPLGLGHLVHQPLELFDFVRRNQRQVHVAWRVRLPAPPCARRQSLV